jgi:hypothetical protein
MACSNCTGYEYRMVLSNHTPPQSPVASRRITKGSATSRNRMPETDDRNLRAMNATRRLDFRCRRRAATGEAVASCGRPIEHDGMDVESVKQVTRRGLKRNEMGAMLVPRLPGWARMRRPCLGGGKAWLGPGWESCQGLQLTRSRWRLLTRETREKIGRHHEE